jgi:hypothetical protein
LGGLTVPLSWLCELGRLYLFEKLRFSPLRLCSVRYMFKK